MRCKATTKKGLQCRKTAGEGQYCHLHKQKVQDEQELGADWFEPAEDEPEELVENSVLKSAECAGARPITLAEISYLAMHLNITIHIIDIIRYSNDEMNMLDLSLNLTGDIMSINAGTSTDVYMVLFHGQYNPLLRYEPSVQGKSRHDTAGYLQKLILANELTNLEKHPIVKNLHYRQLEPAKHNNNCFYFALEECLREWENCYSATDLLKISQHTTRVVC